MIGTTYRPKFLFKKGTKTHKHKVLELPLICQCTLCLNSSEPCACGVLGFFRALYSRIRVPWERIVLKRCRRRVAVQQRPASCIWTRTERKKNVWTMRWCSTSCQASSMISTRYCRGRPPLHFSAETVDLPSPFQNFCERGRASRASTLRFVYAGSLRQQKHSDPCKRVLILTNAFAYLLINWQMIPINNVQRIMKEMLSENVEISKDTTGFMQSCLSKFITHMTTVRLSCWLARVHNS